MIADTLYAKYISEREDAKIIENESGFLTYKIFNNEILILNLFVDKDCRKKGICTNLIYELEGIAKENRCDIISGYIQINDIGCNSTLFTALKIGFKIGAANQQSILIYKKINGGF